MKLTIFLIVLGLCQVHGKSWGQEITLQVKNTSLKQVFKEIRKQSGYDFVYSSALIKQSKKVSVSVKNEKLSVVLDRCFKNQPFTYVVENETIVLREKRLEKSISKIEKISLTTILEQRKIVETTGVVTDVDGEPLIGVNVQVKGSNSGTATDFNGEFTLEDLESGTVLIVSYIGYTTQEIGVADPSLKIMVVLETDSEMLDEVVVVGYGVQRKSDMTGSVGSVTEDALKERPAASMQQSMAGRISGVNVSVNSGRPGGRANIRIRGNTSVSNTNNPLYVIDGVILNVANLANGSSPIDYIEPSNIQSIEVLKDASATAIYGARGANGVILVTTKKGSSTGGKVSYDGYLTIGQMTRKLDLLNSKEFLEIEDLAFANAQKYDSVGFANGRYTDPKLKRTDPRLFDGQGNPLYDSDWQDLASRTAIGQNHQLSFSGGNASDNFGIYLGYRDDQGVMRGSDMTRYSGRIVASSEINHWLTVDGNINYNVQKDNQIDPLGGGGIIPMRQALETLPIIPVTYDDGDWGSNEDYPGMEGGGSYLNIINERDYVLNTQTLLGNITTSIRLGEGLLMKSTFGVNNIDQEINYYAGRDLNFISRGQKGVAEITNNKHRSWQFENYLTYNKTFDDIHSFNGLLGLSWQNVDAFNYRVRSDGFLDDYFLYNNLGVGEDPQSPSSARSEYSLNSYFGRVNYGYDNKYLVTFTGRLDGSSKFGVENRYAFFPSAALGWKVSEEDYFNKDGVISTLKVRASAGITGNSEIPAYRGLAGLGNYTYAFDGSRVVGVGINRLANPDLRWEKNKQIDLGIELGLFDNKIQVELDVYRKLSEDMLLNAPVPSTSGFTSVSQNVGSMENKGVEFSITTFNISKNDFSWDTEFNISYNKNKVLHLTGGADIISGPTIVREGEAVNSFFGYIRSGTWNTDEAEEAAQYNRLPGDQKFTDVNQDGKINDEDRVIIGQGSPDVFGSLINTWEYKNFQLSLDLQFMLGNDVMFETIHSTEDRQGIANSLSTVLNAWTPDNQDTPIAQVRPIQAGYDTFTDSHRLKDGSFLRGRNILLAYNFPASKIGSAGLSRLRLYTSVTNFFLVTDYIGYDPEASTNGSQFAQGTVRYDYPKPRTYTLGVNLGF